MRKHKLKSRNHYDGEYCTCHIIPNAPDTRDNAKCMAHSNHLTFDYAWLKWLRVSRSVCKLCTKRMPVQIKKSLIKVIPHERTFRIRRDVHLPFTTKTPPRKLVCVCQHGSLLQTSKSFTSHKSKYLACSKSLPRPFDNTIRSSHISPNG